MCVGCYDAPVGNLFSSYCSRLQKLVLMGFRSVGLAMDWDNHPRDLHQNETRSTVRLVNEYELELRLHPDLGKVQRLALAENLGLLSCARREMEPILAWAVDIGAISVCCDIIRPSF